jgi:cytochrome c peroxidase
MHELAWGSAAAVAMAALLLLGVTRELAPAGGLTGRGRWLLAAGLGLGVIAFAIKLVAILAFTVAPAPWTHPSRHALPERVRDAELQPMPVPQRRVRWQSLPVQAPAPANNPTTPAKVELGRRLFFDKALSRTGEISCASCHDLLGRAGADGRAVARGIADQAGRRNTPTVWNAAFQARLFWDGRAASLEEQALGPITNPAEMGMPSVAAAVQRLADDPGYQQAFATAFGANENANAITADRLAAALAAFERTLITPDTPYDHFVRGDAGALTPLQVKGMALFESVGCVHCHAGPNFSGASTFDSAAPYRAFPARALSDLDALQLSADPGRASAGSTQGVWRIPSLRNVAVTAPYFHNGSVTNLKEAVRIMARTQLALSIGDAPALMARETHQGQPAGVVLQPASAIAESDVDALTAFLQSLTSPRFRVQPCAASTSAGAGAGSRQPPHC